MDRRSFLQLLSSTAAGAAVGTLALPGIASAARRMSPSDRFNLGVIGVGSRGKDMMRHFLHVPGVRIAALCDVYEPRFAEGRAIAGAQTPVYTDYRAMLQREGESLDAVLIATPIGLHAQHVIAALDAGHPVYGEKSLGFTLDQCNAIVAASDRPGRIFQVGHQYRYAPWCQEAIRRIHAGEIGEVTHVFGYWHRNGSWRRPLPTQTVAGWSATDLEHLINWRLYRNSSHGLLAELGSHQIDIANWIFGSAPHAVVGSGSIVTYRDGRDVYDSVQAIYEYSGGRRFVFSSVQNNRKMGFQIWVQGQDGTVELTLEDATFYYEPSRPHAVKADSALRAGIATGATLRTRGEMPYRGAGKVLQLPGEQVQAELAAARAFIHSVRSKSKPFGDARVGARSAVPVAFGDEAVFAGGRVDFTQQMETVSSPERR
ncbi:MAG: hypothetical protein NVS1B4_05080 [Gemmatimonadaceae bacterium]